METINGCTVIAPSDGPGYLRFGPAEMGGAHVIEIMAVPPGEDGPPLHLHPNTDEAFFVAEGEATFLLGDRELRLTSGGFVFVPRGVPHTVWNSGDGLARGLLIISPGNAEHEFVPVDSE
jgi:mannose-6-phosphate isomerase-like protein (cupin superfamily)